MRLNLTSRAFLHIYLKYTQPLFIQAIMALKNLYDSKPIKIHVLGEPAEGELKRPFKAAGLFGESTQKINRQLTNANRLQEPRVVRRQTRRPSMRLRSELEPRRRTDFVPTCTSIFCFSSYVRPLLVIILAGLI